jgi:DNA polymerase III subunit delta'
MFFNEILGQSSAKKTIQRMASNERMPHAILLVGQEGVGTLPLAFATAQYILCEAKQGEESCGVCRNCSKVSKYIHPDVHYSYPTVGTNKVSTDFITEWRKALKHNTYLNANQWLQYLDAENKQGNINKDECQAIIRKLSLKSFETPYKILIMWLPEYLGKEGNRLLKLIEEPPENTIFLLVAENQELILNTIISRCQVIKVARLSNEEVMQGLIEKQQLAPDKAQTIAQLADGNYNEAISLSLHAENDNAKLFLDWMRKCWKGNGVELMAWVEQFAALGREGQKFFLRYALHFLRELMYLQVIKDNTTTKLLPNELEVASNLAKVLNFEQIPSIATLFDECAYYIERNANAKILFLDTSIQLHKVMKRKG